MAVSAGPVEDLPDPGRLVAAAELALSEVYQIALPVRAIDCLVPAETAKRLLPDPSPRSGVVAVEAEGDLQLGLYLDPRDEGDVDTVVEETSHFLCLAWHARERRRVSALVLELQAEIDRYVMARLGGRDGFAHFEGFRWDDWIGIDERARYELAHRAGRRYCRGRERRFPLRRDTPALLSELRRFYRAPSERKLRETSLAAPT